MSMSIPRTKEEKEAYEKLCQKYEKPIEYIKHPEFSLLEQELFHIIDVLNSSHPKRLKIFTEEVLSKRDNPIEYYKALINFAQD